MQPDEVQGPPRKGLSFAFITDTRPTDEHVELARGVDLLVCEGTYGDDADAEKAVEKRHMTFREAAGIAREAGAGALWLTHFGVGMRSPEAWVRNAKDVFPATEIGFEGLSGQLTFEDGYRGGEPTTADSPESTDSM